jgi:hypothetical protein
MSHSKKIAYSISKIPIHRNERKTRPYTNVFRFPNYVFKIMFRSDD